MGWLFGKSIGMAWSECNPCQYRHYYINNTFVGRYLFRCMALAVRLLHSCCNGREVDGLFAVRSWMWWRWVVGLGEERLVLSCWDLCCAFMIPHRVLRSLFYSTLIYRKSSFWLGREWGLHGGHGVWVLMRCVGGKLKTADRLREMRCGSFHWVLLFCARVEWSHWSNVKCLHIWDGRAKNGSSLTPLWDLSISKESRHDEATTSHSSPSLQKSH